jgi:hypothetical protein
MNRMGPASCIPDIWNASAVLAPIPVPLPGSTQCPPVPLHPQIIVALFKSVLCCIWLTQESLSNNPFPYNYPSQPPLYCLVDFNLTENPQNGEIKEKRKLTAT